MTDDLIDQLVHESGRNGPDPGDSNAWILHKRSFINDLVIQIRIEGGAAQGRRASASQAARRAHRREVPRDPWGPGLARRRQRHPKATQEASVDLDGNRGVSVPRLIEAASSFGAPRCPGPRGPLAKSRAEPCLWSKLAPIRSISATSGRPLLHESRGRGASRAASAAPTDHKHGSGRDLTISGMDGHVGAAGSRANGCGASRGSRLALGDLQLAGVGEGHSLAQALGR